MLSHIPPSSSVLQVDHDSVAIVIHVLNGDFPVDLADSGTDGVWVDTFDIRSIVDDACFAIQPFGTVTWVQTRNTVD